MRWVYPRLPADGHGELDLKLAWVGALQDYQLTNTTVALGAARASGRVRHHARRHDHDSQHESAVLQRRDANARAADSASRVAPSRHVVGARDRERRAARARARWRRHVRRRERRHEPHHRGRQRRISRHAVSRDGSPCSDAARAGRHGAHVDAVAADQRRRHRHRDAERLDGGRAAHRRRHRPSRPRHALAARRHRDCPPRRRGDVRRRWTRASGLARRSRTVLPGCRAARQRVGTISRFGHGERSARARRPRAARRRTLLRPRDARRREPRQGLRSRRAARRGQPDHCPEQGAADEHHGNRRRQGTRLRSGDDARRDRRGFLEATRRQHRRRHGVGESQHRQRHRRAGGALRRRGARCRARVGIIRPHARSQR